ncbi:hypothetical protein [Marinicella rhabdoformis]|uniref:hypothetical protein n=1 Tax=Marinicella rhabdoformis TaxID=2580566 RepID=UPI0012AEB7EC|nr:hypothetical protein [Marinicella rhabdoformis]
MSLITELKRRNVFRVAVAYLVVAWLLVQVLSIATAVFEAPDWVMKLFITMTVIGFLPTVIFSWAFEITSEGIKRETEVVRDESITHITAKRLDYITLLAVSFLAVLIIWQQQSGKPNSQQHAVNKSQPIQATVEASTFDSIAVLPFANRSHQEGDLFFTDGIHDDILTQLAKISAIKVISRTSVMPYRLVNKSIQQIGKELGVSVILEGGVQRAGDQIRMNVQLINVSNDQHLWAETYQRAMTIDNIFDIQSEITRHIITAIKGELSPHEQAILNEQPTNSLKAWELVSQANASIRASGYNAEKFAFAQGFIEEAIKEDPSFVKAWVLLAKVHSLLYWIGYDPSKERQDLVRQALDEAKKLAPRSADVLATEGEYHYRIMLDYEKAYDLQKQALLLKPNDAKTLLALGLSERRLGLWQQAVASMKKAHELDPGDANYLSTAIDTLGLVRDVEGVSELLAMALKRFPDDSDLGAMAVDAQVWGHGDLEKARIILDGVPANSGDIYVGVALSLLWMERDFEGVIKATETPEIEDFFSMYPALLALEQAKAFEFLGNHELKKSKLEKAKGLIGEIDRSKGAFDLSVDLNTLGLVKAMEGATEEAIALANEAMALFPLDKDAVDGSLVHMSAAYIKATAGQTDAALNMVEQLLKTPGGFKRWHLYLDPQWDLLRDNERFNELIKPDTL